MDHALGLPSPLRRTLDDRSLSSRQAGKNYHRKSRARNGTTEYAPGATRGLPLSSQSIPYRVPLPFDSLRDVSPCYFSFLPFSYFYYPLLAFSSLLYPSFLSSRTDGFFLSPLTPSKGERTNTQGVRIKQTAERARAGSIAFLRLKKKEKKR